jgi:hypothetical protein
MRRFAYQHLGFSVITPIDFFRLVPNDYNGALSAKPAACLTLAMDLDSEILQTQAEGKFKPFLDAVVSDVVAGSTVELASDNQVFYDIRVVQKVVGGGVPLTFLEQCRWSDNPSTADRKGLQWLGMRIMTLPRYIFRLRSLFELRVVYVIFIIIIIFFFFSYRKSCCFEF